MRFGIHSLSTPSANTAATLLKNFFPNSESLVLAKGSLLQFYSYKKNNLELINEYNIFGDIVQLVQLKHPDDKQSNLLIICSDYRFSILRYDNSFIVVQTGNIKASAGIEIDPPFKCVVCQNAFMIQICQNSIQYYKVNEGSQLSTPIICAIPCETIVDFGFMYDDGNSFRIAVLYRYFKNSTKVQVYETDGKTAFFQPKANYNLTIESDNYFMTILNENTIVTFSTKIAHRIKFMVTAAPHDQTSTVLTLEPLKMMTQINSTLYIASDFKNQILLIDIAENGVVQVVRVGEVQNPISIIKLDYDKALIVSGSGDSAFFSVDRGHYPQPIIMEKAFSSPGAITKIFHSDNEFQCLCQPSSISTFFKKLPVSKVASMPVSNVNGVFILEW